MTPKPHLYTDENGDTNFDEYEREEKAWSREEEDSFEREREDQEREEENSNQEK